MSKQTTCLWLCTQPIKRGILFFIFLVIISNSFLFSHKRHNRNFKKNHLIKPFEIISNELKKNITLETTVSQSNKNWTWIEFLYYDEKVPLTVDILWDYDLHIDKITYMIAPTGFNFQNTYFSPTGQSMAEYMLNNHSLVVGITFREDKLQQSDINSELTSWGLEKHVIDIRTIVKLFKKVFKVPYDMVGQASAGVAILDYAARYSDKLEKIIVLDTDSFDPAIYPEKVQYAQLTYDALNTVMDQGIFVDPTVNNIKDLIFAGTLFPDQDSGESRAALGLPGNFTFGGLLHFSLLYTASLPGVHTPITGLPGEWVMILGSAAGYYNFNPDPLMDDYSFIHTPLSALQEISVKSGSGFSMIALNRDIYAVQSLNGAYTIDWSEIDEKVIMINSELSSGDQFYYGTLIQQAGNNDVAMHIIYNYGFIDNLYSSTAEQDVWYLFED